MKIDDITSLRCFKYIYESGSLTKASAQMSLSKAAVSKRLDSLEINLGYKLFTRTTRSITPTKNADNIINQVNEIISSLENLERNLSPKNNESIKVRMTCTTGMANRFLGDLLYKFQLAHPHYSIELIATDSVLDVIEHNIDLAVRINPSKNSTLVGRSVGPYKVVAVASPKYLKHQTKLRKVEDLSKHPLLFLDSHAPVLNSLPKGVKESLFKQRSFITNDSPLVMQLILKGEGIGLRSSWDAKALIEEKKLTHVLPENYFKQLGEIWLLSNPERLKSPSVRAVYEYLLNEIPQFF